MKRQKKKIKQRKYINLVKRLNSGICPNCGEKEAHFVPSSLGDKGFFICKKGETKCLNKSTAPLVE